MADRILEHHLQHPGFAGLEILGRGRPQVVEERNGVHAFGREGQRAALLGILALVPARAHLAPLPVVVVGAGEGVVALADVALEADRPQRLRIDVHRVGVLEVEEPAVGRERTAQPHHLIIFPPLLLDLLGGHAHAAHLGVGEHLGLVAHPVVEHFARLVELREERRAAREGAYRRKQSFHHGSL